MVLCGHGGDASPATETGGAVSSTIEAFEVGAVPAKTGGLLLSGQAGGDVEGALIWWVGGHEGDGRVRVPFVIEVDGADLLAGRGGQQVAVGVYAYVVTDDGRVVDYIAQGLILDRAVDGDRIVGSGLKFFGRFILEPDDYTLRVMVQNNASGEYFMSWSILALPFAEDPWPHLLPPVFLDSGSPWTVAKQHGTHVVSIGDKGAGELPAARPVLIENRPAVLYLAGGGWGENAVVEIRIVNELGRTVFEPLVRITDPPFGDLGFRKIEIAPVDLPPGDYGLVVTVADEQASEVLRRALRVTVVGEDGPRVWASVGGPAVPGAGTAAERIERAEKITKKEIRAAYRRALRPLAEGDPVAARRQVAELERRVLASESRTAMLTLGEAELAEAKALAKAAPTCFMPMALLHRDLYRGYSARREGLLSTHARKMAISYAEELGREKPYFGFSEALMVNFAADLAQSGASSGARDLLERALLLNPGYQPALISLGFSLERNSEYLEAVKVYQTLVDTHPQHQEGRLRLGVNLIRTGREDAAEEQLRSLIGTATTPWIRAVAAQELVREKVGKRKTLDEAEGEARAALERMPDDQRLWILLAAILEKMGRHHEAVAILEDLPPAGRGVSPRARYAEWPALGIRASQVHLNRRASEALPALATALGVDGGGE